MTQNSSELFFLTQDKEKLLCIEGKNIYITSHIPKGKKEFVYRVAVEGFDFDQRLGTYNTLEEAKVVLEAIADSIMVGDKVFRMPS